MKGSHLSPNRILYYPRWVERRGGWRILCVCGRGRCMDGKEWTLIIHPWCLISWEDRFGGKTPGFSSPPSEIPLHWWAEVMFMIYEKKTQADALFSLSLELSACLQRAPSSSATPYSSPPFYQEKPAVPVYARAGCFFPTLESIFSHHIILPHLRHILQHVPTFPCRSCLGKVCVHNVSQFCARTWHSPSLIWWEGLQN